MGRTILMIIKGRNVNIILFNLDLKKKFHSFHVRAKASMTSGRSLVSTMSSSCSAETSCAFRACARGVCARRAHARGGRVEAGRAERKEEERLINAMADM